MAVATFGTYVFGTSGGTKNEGGDIGTKSTKVAGSAEAVAPYVSVAHHY